MRRILNKYLLVAIVIASILVGLVFRSRAQKGKGMNYTAQKVERGTITSSVTASGVVISTNTLPVTTNATGFVKNIYVKNGDVVKAGQKIMDLELDLQSQAKKSQALSTYLAAKNSLELAEQSKLSALAGLESDKVKLITARENALVGENFDPTDPTDPTKQKLDAERRSAEINFELSSRKAEASGLSIQKAKTDLSSAWVSYQLSASEVYSPMSGVIYDLTLVPGMVLPSSADNASSSQKVASVRTEGSPVVLINVSEVEATKIVSGQKSIVSFDSLPDKTFSGVVYGIDSLGDVNAGVTSYAVTLKLDTAPARIFPNMSASATVIIETKSDVLTVPSSAIQSVNNQSYVRRISDGREENVAVELGLSSATETEVVSGLTEGDEIITGSSRSGSVSNVSSPFNVFGGGFGSRNVIRMGR